MLDIFQNNSMLIIVVLDLLEKFHPKCKKMRLNQRKTYVRKMSDKNELNSQNNLAQEKN